MSRSNLEKHAGSNKDIVERSADDPENEVEPPATAPGPLSARDLAVLQEHQRVLLARLHAENGEIADIYLGALQVLYGPASADRLALAAHGVREFMNALDKRGPFAVPTPKSADLSNKVNGLQDAWRKISQDNRVVGELSPGFIKKLEKFFGWYEEDRPKRRERVTKLLNRLDPAGKQLPAPLATDRVSAWREMHRFFIKVCHHERRCTDPEFAEHLEGLERFLLDFLQPRTFEHADDLDALILEGEGDG